MSSKHIKYRCKDCLYQAHYRVDYDKHMTLKHKKNTGKDFMYEYCGVEYKIERDLMNHGKVHPKRPEI